MPCYWPCVAVCVTVFVALCSGDEKEAKLRYYFNDFYDFEEFDLPEAQKIFSLPWYNSSRNTVIYCHGFTGNPYGPAVTEVVKAYLEQGESNVALLNWEYLASAVRPGFVNSYSNWAAPNAIELGIRFADTLSNLNRAGLNLKKLHLIGHSLGAHVFGIAGNNMNLKGERLARITGLDPAGKAFDNKPTFLRLNRDSASFVCVIHTDPDKYGMKIAAGTVDFWPNYRHFKSVKQPGCPTSSSPIFSPEDLCNHNRSWQLLISAIKYPNTIIGSYGKNYRAWKNTSKYERTHTALAIESFGHHRLEAACSLLVFVGARYCLPSGRLDFQSMACKKHT